VRKAKGSTTRKHQTSTETFNRPKHRVPLHSIRIFLGQKKQETTSAHETFPSQYLIFSGYNVGVNSEEGRV
jgi:hypothetical protein